MPFIEVGILGILLGGCIVGAYLFLIYPAMVRKKEWRYLYHADNPSEADFEVEEYSSLEEALLQALVDMSADDPERRPYMVKGKYLTLDRSAIEAISTSQLEHHR